MGRCLAHRDVPNERSGHAVVHGQPVVEPLRHVNQVLVPIGPGDGSRLRPARFRFEFAWRGSDADYRPATIAPLLTMLTRLTPLQTWVIDTEPPPILSKLC